MSVKSTKKTGLKGKRVEQPAPPAGIASGDGFDANQDHYSEIAAFNLTVNLRLMHEFNCRFFDGKMDFLVDGLLAPSETIVGAGTAYNNKLYLACRVPELNKVGIVRLQKIPIENCEEESRMYFLVGRPKVDAPKRKRAKVATSR